MATIWCNVPLPPEALEELRAGTEGHRLIVGEGVSYMGNGSAPDPSAEILFGQPEPQSSIELPHLKWVHISSAGYTRYDTPAFREGMKAKGAVLSNSSSVYDEPCAQHLLAFMLAAARRLPQAFSEQAGGRSWSDKQIRAESRLLNGQSVLLVGFGAIARRVVELLAPFEMDVKAVRRTVRGDEPVPTFPIEDLDRLLPDADHVANILPASTSTDGLFDATKFARMKAGAIFSNIGRGTTVHQAALIEALRSGKLEAAYLDVTDPEPLPPEHPLWTTQNCFITPHTAGGHRGEQTRLVRHFIQNLRRFERGERLTDRVM